MQQTIEAWRIIFYVTIVLYAIEIVAYTILASGEEQPWSKGCHQQNSFDGDNESSRMVVVQQEDMPLKSPDEPHTVSYTDEAIRP